MLETDYLTLDEMTVRKRYAGWIKHGAWFAPVALVVLIMDFSSGELSVATTVGVALLIIGAVQAYRIGSQWQERWERLIAEKVAMSAGPR